MPENTVAITRGTAFGNPFRVGGWFMMGDADPKNAGWLRMAYTECLSDDPNERRGYTKIETAAQAVEWYRRYVERYPLPKAVTDHLRGKNLACYCKLGEPCHGDVLLEIVNR